MRHFLKRWQFLPVILLALLPAHSALATKLVHRNVAELTTMADRIFAGKCVSVEAKTIAVAGYSLPVIEYTFSVTQSIKGTAAGTLIFRQFGTLHGAGSVVGMPTYQQAKQYLLFLGKDSEYGLTSPIGFGQGAFLIFNDETGTTRAMNAFGNRGLFRRMDEGQPVLAKASLNLAEQKMLQKTAGAVPFDHLISFVKKLTG